MTAVKALLKSHAVPQCIKLMSAGMLPTPYTSLGAVHKAVWPAMHACLLSTFLLCPPSMTVLIRVSSLESFERLMSTVQTNLNAARILSCSPPAALIPAPCTFHTGSHLRNLPKDAKGLQPLSLRIFLDFSLVEVFTSTGRSLSSWTSLLWKCSHLQVDFAPICSQSRLVIICRPVYKGRLPGCNGTRTSRSSQRC